MSNLDNLPFLSQMTYEGVVYLKRKPRIEVQGWSYVLHFLMRYLIVLKSSGSKMVVCLSLMRILEYDWWKIMTYIVFQIGLHMHTVPQNKDKFTINNLFYCCKALLFTQSSVCEFLCGLIFMGHPVSSSCHFFFVVEAY